MTETEASSTSSRSIVPSRLAKRDLLTFLARTGEAGAGEVAGAFGISDSVAAMALLRLVRQGLATRQRGPARSGYRYQLSERGQSRLSYLQGQEGK